MKSAQKAESYFFISAYKYLQETHPKQQAQSLPGFSLQGTRPKWGFKVKSVQTPKQKKYKSSYISSTNGLKVINHLRIQLFKIFNCH